MSIGTKIREIRLAKSMTQAELCQDKITRNMLSLIERESATPSLSTLEYIAERLDTPLFYFLTDEMSLFEAKKAKAIEGIRAAYSEKRYLDCINRINSIGEFDDELSMIIAFCYFAVGKASLLSGALLTASSQLELCEAHCARTVYNVSLITTAMPIYKALTRNIQSPLLELDVKTFDSNIELAGEYELFKYISMDLDFEYKNELFKLHAHAKKLIKNRRYLDALSVLKDLENRKSTIGYNAYAYFSIYSDIEACYKQIGDFENAYRYSSKRMSMLEGFKS